jgi:hypothetical protein
VLSGFEDARDDFVGVNVDLEGVEEAEEGESESVV